MITTIIGPHELHVALDSLQVDGGEYGSRGTLYASFDEWNDNVKLSDEWRSFAKLVHDAGWRPPAGITLEKIREARRLLGVATT